ncbi:MAG: hypothetical protein OEM29_03510 [Thermoplasmata archaeon]|nr:hypothetical protein [Thermoplasmata archaeon]
MRPRSIITAAMAAFLLCVCAHSSALAEGDEWSSQERWTFTIDTVIEEVPVSGTMTYDRVGEEALSVGDTSYQVDVFRITGSFDGVSLPLGVGSSASGVYDGYIYQTIGTPAVVMREMTTIVNITSYSGTLQLAEQVQMIETICYLPPFMSGFAPLSVEQDDRWNETVEVIQVISFHNGTASLDDETVVATRMEFSVDSVDEPVETEAGVFECIRLFVSQDSTAEIIWYSSDVCMSVRTERYDNSSAEPVFVAELSSYQSYDDSDHSMLLLVAVGVVVSATALAITGIIAMKRSSESSVRSEKTIDESPRSGEEGARQNDSPNNGGRQ